MVYYIMNLNLNTPNLVKYFVMFMVVYFSTKVIPTCGVLQQHAVYVGLIASTTFALLDTCSPSIVVKSDGSRDPHHHSPQHPY